jgi:hypothetical protein
VNIAQPAGLKGAEVKNRIVSISLAVVLALSAGLVGCGDEGAPEITEYNLTISSTDGGSVTSPGQLGPYTYGEGTVVNLLAEAEEGYHFVKWTGDVSTIDDVNAASTSITMNGDYEITANFETASATRYNLTISSTTGGSVTVPGDGIFAYDEGTVANIVAAAEEGYRFVDWTGDVDTIADVEDPNTTITINNDCSAVANFALGTVVQNWHDLDAIRDDLAGTYILTNGLDSVTQGYEELAGPTANEGKGWEPIAGFAGSFDGQGYEIVGLFINRPDEWEVGLFGYVDEGGVIENIGVINANVIGSCYVGGLVGKNEGSVSNSYSTGSVIGGYDTGGLVGTNYGTGSNSYSTGSVTGHLGTGGLLGWSPLPVSSSFWDTETSGQSTSAGGTGKTTAAMKNIATFSGAGWNIVTVANLGTRNPSYIWNIVDGQTYPFLGWQS